MLRHTRLLSTLVLLLLAAPVLAGVTAAEKTYPATAYCAWEKSDLNVVVVPPAYGSIYGFEPGEDFSSGLVVFEPEPAAPWDAAHGRAAVDAVKAWERAMHAYAASNPEAAHLADFSLRVTIAGPGADPAVLAAPDALVLFVPTMKDGGFATQSCGPVTSPMHCDPAGTEACYGGNSVAVITSWFVYSTTPNDTYNIVMHEFGHILGLDHVTAPAEDVMQAMYPFYIGGVTNPRECVSTLNTAMLASSHAWMAGAPYDHSPEPVWLSESQYALFC